MVRGVADMRMRFGSRREEGGTEGGREERAYGKSIMSVNKAP